MHPSLQSACCRIHSLVLPAVCQQLHLLPERTQMSTKRGPLDLYFTRIPGTKSKKPKPDVSLQAASKDYSNDLAEPAAGGSAPWDHLGIPTQAPEQEQKQTVDQVAAALHTDPDAPLNKAAVAANAASENPGSAVTAGAAGAAGAAAGQAGTYRGNAAAVTAASDSAAAGGAGGGALRALMSAARGKVQPKQSAPDHKQLSTQEMRELARRNQAATQAAVQAAAAAGQQPQLRVLLVEPSWLKVLGPEFDKPYLTQLQSFVEKEWSANTIYPPKESIFRAFNSVPFDQVRVVILGQDPYINPGEAMGLSFSVPPGVRIPPSLQNMYKELEADLGCKRPNHGCLEKWCHQGVLLLNASLTVRAKASNSHAGQGWEGLTSAALQALATQRSGIVFLLWGKYAQDRCEKLDMKKHHVLKSVHPSPLSAHRGFLGCKHFSTTNKLLQQSGLPPVDWQIENV